MQQTKRFKGFVKAELLLPNQIGPSAWSLFVFLPRLAMRKLMPMIAAAEKKIGPRAWPLSVVLPRLAAKERSLCTISP